MRPTYNRLMNSAKPGVREQRYRLSNADIIDRLGIAREEMGVLRIILAPEIAKERQLTYDTAYSSRRRSPKSEASK